MCDIAPFSMKCDIEDCGATTCAFHKLNFALNELYTELPILKHFIEPYQCPDFTPKEEEDG